MGGQMTEEVLVKRAEEMIPTLKGRAADDAKNRFLSEKTVQEIKDAGLVGVVKPKKWGGHQLTPHCMTDISMTLARGDMSVAWVYGLWANHAYHLSFYDDRAQKDVWGDVKEEPIISSSYSPAGGATRVDGGYKLSGRWKWSSGSKYADWFLLSSFASDRPGEVLCFLLPREDVKIIDVWNVTGLNSTGSNDLVVKDAFVPDHRLLGFLDLFNGESPSTNSESAAIYNLSPISVFYRVITAPMIGTLEALTEEFIRTGRERSTSGGLITENPDAVLALGQAIGAVEEMKIVQRATFDKLLALAEKGEIATINDRLRYRYQSGNVADTCIRNAKALFEATSGLAMMEEATTTGSIYRNLICAGQHLGSQYKRFARALAANHFGAECKEVML